VTPDISIVIPLRDEEANVLALHEELTVALERLERPYEVILIDDGSRDRTFDRLAEVQARDPRVRVVRFETNFGQTAAFAAGFARARAPLIVTADGDLQTDPADIPRMLRIAEQGFDVVVGWRKERKDGYLTRHLPSVVANWLLSRVTGIALHDNGCSLKVFRASVVKPLRLSHGMHRYLPVLASQIGGRITEVVVSHRPRRHGRSKYGLSRTFRVVVDLIRMRELMRQAVDPHREPESLYEIRDVLEAAV
jgi:glycosyltransferase involved in cell wall biosynthesis